EHEQRHQRTECSEQPKRRRLQMDAALKLLTDAVDRVELDPASACQPLSSRLERGQIAIGVLQTDPERRELGKPAAVGASERICQPGVSGLVRESRIAR